MINKPYIVNRLTPFFSHRFERWLNKKMPANNKQRLTRKNVFIFPSRFGLYYLLLSVVIFLLGTNYQNNIIILLSYLLVSLFLSAMFHCFYNLSGLTVSQEYEVSGYNKQQLYIPINLSSKNRRYSLSFQFRHQAPLNIAELPVGQTTINIPFIPQLRGKINTGRLKIASEYSLGLFNCWTHVDLNCLLIVYPQPQAFTQSTAPSHNINNKQHDLGKLEVVGVEDFSELKTYHVGESLSQVAWKQVARGQGWLTKHYIETKGENLALRLQDMPLVSREIQLSYLCYLVCEHHKLGNIYSLELDSTHTVMEAGQGQQHFQQCLLALAHYPKESC